MPDKPLEDTNDLLASLNDDENTEQGEKGSPHSWTPSENGPSEDEATPPGTPQEGFIALSEYNLLLEKYNILQKKYDELESRHHRGDTAPEGLVHVVKKGEEKAIRGICQHYGTTLSKVEQLNKPANLRHLVPGQRLRIK